MAIGETILGAVLQVVFDRLASPQVLNFLKSSKLDQSLVDKLKRHMLAAGKVLDDAEQKQITDSKIKSWLEDLKHLFYRAEEIAIEINTEALRSSMDPSPEPESFGTKVLYLIPAFRSTSSFVKRINSEMGDVATLLEEMVNMSAALNLRELSGHTASGRDCENTRATTYLLEDTEVVGRGDEKGELLNLLVSEKAKRNRITVVAIVGMGGMGKTTLAKLIYNDESLEPFDLKAWVYVSDQFNISRVTKSILESITGQSYSDSHDLNYLQHELSGKLRGKRFFLALDDVWNENYEEWLSLSAPLIVGAHGSKIIVTTRNDKVASKMCNIDPVIRLKPLSEEEGWSLFSKHAFEVGSSSYPCLVNLGKQIVDKCHGLPLAIKTLGGLLRSEQDIKKWEAILHSSLWDLPANESNVAPALRLSYFHLPPHLKRCFSYCAIFPKGSEFDRNTLVLLWMAENLVHLTDPRKRIEDIGDEYLDLALAASGEFAARQEDVDTAVDVSDKTRHFSYLQRSDSFAKLEGLSAAKYLRTLVPSNIGKSWYLRNKSPAKCTPQYGIRKSHNAEMIPQFYCLHVLCLSNYILHELPESTENLKQLRYLDVCETRIKQLPESVSSLCN